jgi:hypothetical protein
MLRLIESSTVLSVAGLSTRPGTVGTVESRCIMSGFGIA